MYKVKKYLSDIFLFTCLLTVGLYGLYLHLNQEPVTVTEAEPVEEEIITKYGFDVSKHFFEDYKIKRNAFMGDILMSYGISFDDILELERKAEDVYSLRKIKAGKNITFIKKDECGYPTGFVYKPSKLSYIQYDLDEDISVTKHDLPFEVCIETASGVVEKSLWVAMMDQGFDYGLIDELADALSQVYFPQAQKGDQFKLVFERVYVDGEPIGTGKVYSAAYQSRGSIFHGFYYENDRYHGYYDLEGTPNKKTFLRAPVRFSRLSSGYNPNRYHPILKRRKPHLGTDYAAPRGTPIFAVADGIVTKRSYTKGNGNYIKIKHDNVYQTQYLHMSKFAKGIRPGSHVAQGQTIGYVGSTGLATGPHVCFRFWKNGRQVNHLRENFPPLNPLEESELPNYFKVRDQLLQELEAVPFVEVPVAYAGYSDD